MNWKFQRIICVWLMCICLFGCMPGVSNDPDESPDPWQDSLKGPEWVEEFWDIPMPTEVYPLYMSNLLEMKDEAFELSMGTRNRESGTVIYRFYKGCISIIQVKILTDIEYFICPYGDTYRCYRRECPAGNIPGEFELVREFSSESEMKEHLTYCLDGTFPSFAALVGIDQNATYHKKFEYEWTNPDTGETSPITYDMYLLANDSGEDVLLFADPQTNMIARIIFPEQATDFNLPTRWREWNDDQLFEQMLVANYISTKHYHQMLESESSKWNELISSLSTVR